MNIGFDAKRLYHNSSGLGNYSRDLVRMLSAHFPQHTYLLYNPKTNNRYSLEAPNIKERLPQGRLAKTFPNLWRSSLIKQDLKADKVDIFHGLSAELPAGISATGIKSVVTVHDLIFMRSPELYTFIDRRIYERKVRAAVAEADQIIAISEQTKQDIISYLKVPESKIDVVYQGCHPAFKSIIPAETLQKLKQKLGLPSEFILNVGTVEKRKNALSVVKALTQLDIPLVIVGRQTDYAQEIKAYAAKAQISHRLFFVQGLSMAELAGLYQAALAFVYPSQFEGFGIPIIEALFSGTPVITNQAGVFPEAGGPSSCYIDPADTEQFKDAIQKVLSQAPLREHMRAEGLAYANNFTDAKIANQLMDTYTKLML